MLNPMQQQAVECTDGPLLILAGAGSGKTRVITHRIARLIDSVTEPFHILAITFTNKAAREMRSRVDDLTPTGHQVWVSTFHSLCVRILRRDIHYLGYDRSFTIFDADDAEKLVHKCIKEMNVNEKNYPAKSVLHTIGTQKDELVGPLNYMREVGEDFKLKVVAKIYKAYQDTLMRNNALDFDDIIFKTVELFAKFPEVLERYQDRFRYISVDEYQDTNTAQYRLVQYLSAKYRNLCVVGDDDQSIYGWRGANIKNILDFQKDFPDATVIKLEQNYRSTKNILAAANAVIERNKSRKRKKLWTDNDTGKTLEVYKAEDERLEAAYIAHRIKEGVRNGRNYHEYAVLFRNNAQSRSLEDEMVRRSIPYRLFGGVRFYERMEIKDILAYLKALYNPNDDISYMRIINTPRRGIGNTTIGKISEISSAEQIPFSSAMRKSDNKRVAEFVTLMDGLSAYAKENKVTDIINKVIEETEYNISLYKEGSEQAMNRIDNINQLIAKAVEYENNSVSIVSEEDNDLAGADPDEDVRAVSGSLAGFLEDVALVADIDNYVEGEDSVLMMTMHSAKGLEFPCVFIAGMEDGLFPGYRAITSTSPKDMEEERRLCYVGITRAEEEVVLTHASSRILYGSRNYNSPSRFLKEIPRELID